jgi:hypothetical protein
MALGIGVFKKKNSLNQPNLSLVTVVNGIGDRVFLRRIA